MKTITFDFETRDPFIKHKFGSGWIYKYHNYQNCDFEVLGMAFNDGETSDYITDFRNLDKIFKGKDIAIAHNAAYDLGCLLALGYEDLVNKLYGRTVCTIMASKLHDSSRMSYSLDNMVKSHLGKKKQGITMVQEVWDSEIYPLTQKEQKAKLKFLKDNEGARQENWERGPIVKTVLSRVKNWVYANLDVVQEKSLDFVAKYAISDADLTHDLFHKLLEKSINAYRNPVQTWAYWSRLIHVCQDYTKRGIRVNLETIDEAGQYLQPKITENIAKIYEIAGKEFTITSSPQLSQVFLDLGLPVGTTATGRPSVTKDILEKTNHPIAQLIRDTKQYQNIKNNFIDKMLRIQEFTLKEGENPLRTHGRVHPQYMAMGAKTGRFSCNGPNLQQIPKRNKELGRWCRGIFEPEAGDKWYSLDFSNQEGRLQVHYATKLKCQGYTDLVSKFKVDPNYDLHQEVADSLSMMLGYEFERKPAKTVNLGISYGMGGGTLCEMLGLPTKMVYSKRLGKMIKVAGEEGQDIINGYHDIFPFLKQLIDKTTHSAKANKFIRTIGGRVVTNDKAMIEGKYTIFYHKAFNQLIQGSAFDQTAICMIKAFEANLPVMVTIHDELGLSGNDEQANQLQDIMENSVVLDIPSVTDIGKGSTWWDAC